MVPGHPPLLPVAPLSPPSPHSQAAGQAGALLHWGHDGVAEAIGGEASALGLGSLGTRADSEQALSPGGPACPKGNHHSPREQSSPQPLSTCLTRLRTPQEPPGGQDPFSTCLHLPLLQHECGPCSLSQRTRPCSCPHRELPLASCLAHVPPLSQLPCPGSRDTVGQHRPLELLLQGHRQEGPWTEPPPSPPWLPSSRRALEAPPALAPRPR